jgi:hypothetical protein
LPSTQSNEQDGYVEGTCVNLKIYHKANRETHYILYERIEGPTSYTSFATLLAKGKSLTTGTSDQQQQSLILRKNQPNPLTDKATISYYLLQSGK